MPKKTTTQNSSIEQADLPEIISSSHHDKLFKRFFLENQFAIELVRLILSKEETLKCDLSRLKPEKNLFKDKKMDLVLSIPLKGLPKNKIRMVILFEHKSKYDKNLFKQVLGYQTRLYEQSKQTIAVIPVLFYHGKPPLRSSKNRKLSFQEAILGPFFLKIPRSIRKDMLHYNLRLLDTGDKKIQKVFNDQRFKIGPVLQLLDRVWSLKNDERELKKILFAFFKAFSAEEWILAVAKYLKASGIRPKIWNKLENEAIKKGLLNKGGYMDIREEIRLEGKLEGIQKGRQEGMQAGRQAGRQEGIKSIIFNMLKKKAKIPFISEMTGMSEKEIKKLQNGK